MTVYEQELRKLFEHSNLVDRPQFSGRVCVGDLGKDLRVRAEFLSTHISSQYDAIRLTVLNRTEGVVDRTLLRFQDVWGKKQVPNNPNFRSGVIPHLWDDYGKVEWYAYHPTAADYAALRDAVGQYLSAFRERTPELERSGPKLVYICAPLRGDVTNNVEFARQKAQEVFVEGNIIIVDEAHKLPETAQQMLGVTLTVEEIRNLILQLKEERYLLAAEMLEDSTGPLLRKLAQPREEAEPVEAYLCLLTAPSCTLPIIRRQIGSLLSPLGSRQLNTVLDAVKLFTSTQTDMIFYTAEDVSTGGAMLCAAAGDITQRIKKILWQPDQAFVLTSGTMAVGSDFRRFKTQAGLEKGHRVMESVSPSPFDYRNNCLLYLPQILPRQRVEDTDVYFNELTAELVGLIKAATGHALVLFTSYAAMSAVKERLREESLPFPLLTLGRNAPHIIEQFRHTPGAVLLATGAAWEGFDFPGDCVSLLIIPRLPFAYPDARKERELEKYSSLHAFIREVAVPEMQIKLRQGFGRAIRTESDTCVIAILDERACRGRRYAQAVSEALPEMRRTGSLREVTRFLREKKPESYFEVER